MSQRRAPTILYYSPAAIGGIAEYASCQVKALRQAGATVVWLVPPLFLDGRHSDAEQLACLRMSLPLKGPRLLKKVASVLCLLSNQFVLAWQIWKRRPDLVMLDSYVEYLSPFWVWPHLFLARVCGIRFGANLHDPVRNFVVGPKWWHRLSVWLTYLPLEFVFVHEMPSQPSPVPARVGVVQVPHGIFEISEPQASQSDIRRRWGVKNEQKVFLAFGHVRDGKNLDLVIKAMAQVPEAFLVVAGAVASSKDKTFDYYRGLAEQQGVDARCCFNEGFISDRAIGEYFLGSDFILLTYSASFHSQSGVLNLAVRARKPVLASAAPSPLIASVKKFKLGHTVEPDSLAGVLEGMKLLIMTPIAPAWSDYEASASWRANADIVLASADITHVDADPARTAPLLH